MIRASRRAANRLTMFPRLLTAVGRSLVAICSLCASPQFPLVQSDFIFASEPPRPAAAPATRPTVRAKGEFTFDDLKFDIEKGGQFQRTMLTKAIEDLNKKPMRIRGYILPASVYKQTGITEFVLVRDNKECCFGPGAAIYDCIFVQMEKGKTADFKVRPVAVQGKFEIEEMKYPDGTLYAIYKLNASEVK